MVLWALSLILKWKMYGNEQNYPGSGVHDLNMVTNAEGQYIYPMSIPGDQDVIVRNDIPIVDDQVFNVPSTGLDSMSSRYQPPNNNMTADYDMNRVPNFETAYHGMSGVPHIESLIGTMDRNCFGANYYGVRNFDMSVVDADTQSYIRHPREINRSFTNLSGSASEVEQSIIPRVHRNQVGLNSSQPDSCEILDGRLLSLGYQSNVPSNINNNASGGTVSHMNMNETLFSTQGQLPSNSYNHIRGSLAGFQNNVDGLSIPWDHVGNLTLSGDDHFGLQAMSFGHDMSLMPNLQGGQVNMQHTIATPGNRISQSETEADARMFPRDTSEAYPHMPINVSGHNQEPARYMKERMQKVPFNSSVLRNFHQNAAAELQNLHSSTNQMLAPGINAGESGCQDMLGLAQGSGISSSSVQTAEGDFLHSSNWLLPPGQFHSPTTGRDRYSTGQRADITVKNEFARASPAVGRKSLKRNLDLSPQTSIHGQRRKIAPQTSAHQFSPYLLQNALGQIAADHSMPALTTTANFIVPSAALKDFAASGPNNLTPSPPVAGTVVASSTARIPQLPTPYEAAFVSPIHNPATCSAYDYETISLAMPRSTMIPSASHASTPGISAVAAEMPQSSISAHPPMDPAPTTLATKTGTRSVSARIPNPATSKRAMARSPASTAALRKTQLRHPNSSMAPSSVSDWRLSAIAALAKATPGSRALQLPSSMPRIQWKGFDIPPTVGFNCMLCKRDLSFTPEGPVVQPPIPPAVAVLPCGHTFHDHCLQLITPEDEAKGPPCIPCAMGEK